MIPFRLAISRIECPGRREYQVFPVGTEVGRIDFVPAVGNLVFLFGIEVIKDKIICIFLRTYISQVFAIGRPVVAVEGTDTGCFYGFCFTCSDVCNV